MSIYFVERKADYRGTLARETTWLRLAFYVAADERNNV